MSTAPTHTKPIVLKIGGHEIADEAFLAQLAETVRDLQRPIVIVHGGGAEISALQTSLDITPRYEQGVRVTDAHSLTVVQMVLCGIVNKRLVHRLSNVGVDAVGISGVDHRLITARKMPHPEIDMGYTGIIEQVRPHILHNLLAQNITPIIAPLCYGEDAIYNVNADHVAGAVATAIQAESVVFLTNVAGVLVHGQTLSHLTPHQAHTYIQQGIITGGMIPKVRTALDALEKGVPRAMITNLAGLRHHTGTTCIPDQANHEEMN